VLHSLFPSDILDIEPTYWCNARGRFEKGA